MFHWFKFLGTLWSSFKYWTGMTNSKLLEGVRAGNQQQIEEALQEGAEMNCTGYDRDTPLLVAVRQQNLAAVSQLLNLGADINQKGGINQETPLIAAVRESKFGDTSIVNLLISKGASFEITDIHKNGPLEVAMKNPDGKVFDLIIKNDPRLKPDTDNLEQKQIILNRLLFTAISENRVNLIQKLRTSGAQFEVCNPDGHTPLLAAASKGRKEILDDLIVCQANTTARDKDGNTALHLAAREGQTLCIQRLMELEKIETSVTNSFGQTPLQFVELKIKDLKNKLEKSKNNYESKNDMLMGITVLEGASIIKNENKFEDKLRDGVCAIENTRLISRRFQSKFQQEQKDITAEIEKFEKIKQCLELGPTMRGRDSASYTPHREGQRSEQSNRRAEHFVGVNSSIPREQPSNRATLRFSQ